MGWSRPCARTESVSESSWLSSKRRRGCTRPGWRYSMGTRWPGGGASVSPFSPKVGVRVVASSPRRAARPRPKPRFEAGVPELLMDAYPQDQEAKSGCESRDRGQGPPFPLQYFARQAKISLGATAAQVVEQDRFSVGRRFRDTHIAGDHGVVHPVAQVQAHVVRLHLGDRVYDTMIPRDRKS